MALSMNMMRLFDDMTDSPVSRTGSSLWTEADIAAIVTPLGKGDYCGISKSSSPFLMDEDSGLGMEMDTAEEFRPMAVASPGLNASSSGLNGSFTESSFIFRRPAKSRQYQAKRSLFAGKRSAEITGDDSRPTVKKLRNSDSELHHVASPKSACAGPEVQNIIRAVDRLSTQQELVADGSRDYSLPVVHGKHSDLKSISAHTMARLLTGEFGDLTERTQIIDCRYPYEYNGGHIQGAVNLYTKDEIDRLLDASATPRPRVLIFHCEFSSERGPKMYRFLRSQDRARNQDNYPALNYPEVYLLEGGYQRFYAAHKNLCDPDSYKPMLHQDHSDDLRHFRTKSKSWSGKQKKSSRSRLSTGRSLSFQY